MKELIPIETSKFRTYSRNNYLPVYSDTENNTTFVGLNLNPTEALRKTYTQVYVLDTQYAFRPDLLSYKFYRTPLLGWYICLANDVVDPFDPDTGLYPGRQIMIPSLDYVFQQVI